MHYKFAHNLFSIDFQYRNVWLSSRSWKKLMFSIDQQYRKKALKNGYFIKMVLKIAEYHDKIHFDLSSFFIIMKISFFSLAVWCVDCSSTWDCFKQHSAEHYQCKHVARKISSYVKQIATPIVDILPDSLNQQCDFAGSMLLQIQHFY